MMEIEELLTHNKLDQVSGGGNNYTKSELQNFTAHYASHQSSLMSERTERVTSHYGSQGLNGVGKKKMKRDDDSLSISNPCDVRCNIF